MPRPAMLASGGPKMPAGPPMFPGAPTPTAEAAPAPLALDSAGGATEPNAGAAVAQLCGPDNAPSEPAWPTPAVTAAPPIPGEPNTPAPEPKPPPSADPNVGNWLPKALTGLTEFMSELAEPIIDRPEVAIEADEPAPEARPLPDVRVVNDDSGDVDDEDDVAEAVEVRLCNAFGAAAALSGVDVVAASGVDIAVVSGDTV